MPVPGLYIGSTAPYAGKNTLSIGLGMRFCKEGLNIGYMKPVGAIPVEKNGHTYDEDALYVRDVLNIHDHQEHVSPIIVTQDFRIRAFTSQFESQSGEFLQSIKNSYATLSQGKDMMLVAGSGSVFSSRYCRLDGLRLIRELGFKAVIIDRMEHELNYDTLIAIKDALGDNLAGVVLNSIPQHFMTEVDGLIRPFLEKNNIQVLGVLPKDPLLGSVRAFAIAEALNGKIVSAQQRSERLVESFLIGTMQVENFMTYFRRTQKAAVIVGGDRADIQLVAIEGDCACLILTGNLYPNDIILSRAEALNVPIIMVRDDTYNIARKMEQMIGRHKLRDTIKIRQAAQLISSNLDIHSIRKSIGV